MVLAQFLSNPQVFSSSVVELVGTFSLVTLVVGAYRHFECHVSSCHRVGRFMHGHYKLCSVHHPHVPNDGKIGAEQIAEVDAKLAAAAKPAPAAKPAKPA
jgi:hypothetical protein